ncbi:sugar transferase [Winogradskyella ursingii]|uniref:sugar transferase n=1 Tax=Winogradskyella ursingii TaxID=2686079 RepID=UPI0015C803C4|nr:sugar transferase [Winogradskyella ursingii]
MYRNFFKRIIDIIVSALGLVILSPIILVLIVLLTISNKGKAFFVHERPGKDGKVFKLLKFKSMTDEKDENGELLDHHLRVTHVGDFIRKLSLDEIPQLINVLKGDMSLIGPRPLLIDYLPLYNDHQRQRHNVRPGISGWAQVNGRNSISWDEKFDLDVWYVNNISFKTDFKIFVMTLGKVLLKEGVNVTSDLSMTRFEGNN